MTTKNLSRVPDEELDTSTPEGLVERTKRDLEARIRAEPHSTKRVPIYSRPPVDEPGLSEMARLVGTKAVEDALGGAPLPKKGITQREDSVSTGGLKADAGKPPLALLPFDALTEVAKVLDYGRGTYSAHNWRAGIGYHRLLDAALRHLAAFTLGEDDDPETGLSHLAHSTCNILFLLSFHTAGRTNLDDRYNSDASK